MPLARVCGDAHEREAGALPRSQQTCPALSGGGGGLELEKIGREERPHRLARAEPSAEPVRAGVQGQVPRGSPSGTAADLARVRT